MTDDVTPTVGAAGPTPSDGAQQAPQIAPPAAAVGYPPPPGGYGQYGYAQGGVPPGYGAPQGAYGGGGYTYPAPSAGKRGPGRGWLIFFVVAILALCTVATIWAVVVGSRTSGGSIAGTLGGSVGVIRLEGVISGSGAGGVTPDRMSRSFRRAINDNSVKAIVLRVESPGGTVAASEEIADMVKKAKAAKPVVVSIGDQGASGAYMVSSQASKIYAMPGSSVGSIGVIAEVPNIEGLLKKLGISFAIITAGEYKGTGNPYQPLTEEQRKLLQQDVDEVYGQFIDIVAEGRKMPRSQVETLANGWAWNGSKAKELGLVDELGGYSDAVDEAARLGGIKGEPRIVDFNEYDPTALFGSLLSEGGTSLLPSREKLPETLPK